MLDLAALADLAVGVSGKCLDNEVAHVPHGHGPTLDVVITDGRRADVLMLAIAGVKRQPYGRRAVDTWCRILDADGNPDPYADLAVSAPCADTIDARNAEYVGTTDRRGRRPSAEGERDGTRSDDKNTAQHGRIPCTELI